VIETLPFMTQAVGLYEQIGFARWPERDWDASTLLLASPTRRR
jgi:hypothetical protein